MINVSIMIRKTAQEEEQHPGTWQRAIEIVQICHLISEDETDDRVGILRSHDRGESLQVNTNPKMEQPDRERLSNERDEEEPAPRHNTEPSLIVH
jgi:hypothetical protein